MHDYQLDRLNTRSFEQLVQALAAQILGNQISIFGDGPDGGREASFDGPVQYPAGQKPWNGYGIVQAKFRQVPDKSPALNAGWLLKQLRDEFQAFTPCRRDRQGDNPERSCPDYYILATNISLSSVHERGGKDRVRTQFEELKKSHGLKGYAIWDGVELRRFIDSCPG